MWKEISSAPTLARCGKESRQHQTWHDVERKRVSAEPNACGKKTHKRSTWRDVERTLVITKPGASWKGKASAQDLPRSGKKTS